MNKTPRKKHFFCLILFAAMFSPAYAQEYINLDAITITAERPDWEEILSPGSVSVIEIDDFKGEQKDLSEILEQVPGIYVQRVTGDNQYTVARIRGSTGAQVNVYVDGVLQNAGNDIAVDLSLIPLSSIERVEVYKGYIPSRFSGAPIGGVINIVTKRPERLSVMAEAGFSSFGGQSYTLAATVPTFFDGAALIGGSYKRNEGDFPYITSYLTNGYFNAANGGKEMRRQYNDSESTDLLFKWQNENFSIKSAYKIMDRRLPFRTGETRSEGFYSQTASQFDAVAGYNHIWEKATAGIQFFYINQSKENRTERYNFNSAYYPIYPGAVWSDRDTEKWGIAADTSYNLGDRNLLEFHGDYSQETLRVDANDWIWQGDPIKDYQFYPRYDETRIHLQLQDTLTLGRNWDTWLTGIVRADKVNSTGNSQSEDDWRYSWGLSLKKEINDHITFKSSYGTFNRFPNFTEKYGDGLFIMPTYISIAKYFPSPTWETGQMWDAGLDFKGGLFGGKWRLSVAYFDRHTENMIGMYANKSFSYFVNAGMAHAQGIEADGSLTLEAFSFSFHYTHQQGTVNRILTYSNTSTSGLTEPITNIPEDQLMLRVAYRLFEGRVTVFSEYQYTGAIYKMRLEGNNSDSWVKDDALSIVNVGVSWELIRNLTLTTGINDLLNAGPSQGQHATNYTASNGDNLGTIRYNSILDYSSPGTTYYVTLRYEWQ